MTHHKVIDNFKKNIFVILKVILGVLEGVTNPNFVKNHVKYVLRAESVKKARLQKAALSTSHP